MSPTYEISRKDYIRLKLKRGDIKKIADILGIHSEWVSRVISGNGVSEPILLTAERLIAEREKEQETKLHEQEKEQNNEQERGLDAGRKRKREKLPLF